MGDRPRIGRMRRTLTDFLYDQVRSVASARSAVYWVGISQPDHKTVGGLWRIIYNDWYRRLSCRRRSPQRLVKVAAGIASTTSASEMRL